MRRLAEFVWTTVLGGVLVLLPIGLSVALLAHALAAAMGLLGPVVASLPPEMYLRRIVAFAIVVAVCFVAGAIVRTRVGHWVKGELDRYLLERIPGYTLVRGLAGRITGQEEGAVFAAALVELEDALVPAFIVEEHPDGRYTVFVPSVPTPAAGTVYILTPERVHLVDVPFTQALSVVTKWGAGSRDLVAAMRSPKA